MTELTAKLQTAAALKRFMTCLCWVAVFSAPAITLVFINRLAIDLPIADEWEYAKLIIKLRAHTVTFSDLWAQHNEHRLLVPRLILIAIHTIRGFWHTPDLMNLSWGFAAFTFLLMLKLIWQLIPQTIWRMSAAFATSLLLFTFAQDQTWLMGITNAWFLVNLLFVATIVFLSLNHAHKLSANTSRLFLLAIVSTVIATYSTGTAFPMWLALIPLIWLSQPPQRRPVTLLIWFICAGLTLSLYFYDYNKPSAHPDLLFGLRNPIPFFLYITAYIGNPFSQGFPAWTSALLGFIGFVSFIYLAYKISRVQGISAFQIYVPVTMVLFAVGNAIITALTRVGFGWEEQALSSRYATISVYFWIGLIWIEIIWLSNAKTLSFSALIKDSPIRFAGLALCVPMLILASVASTQSYVRAEARFIERTRYLLPALYQYHESDDKSLNRLLLQGASQVREISASLEKLQEGPFSPLSRAIYLNRQVH